MTEQELNAQRIGSWLEDHPDFFNQFPDLLDKLQVPQNSEGVTSLITFQNKRLIEQNQKLNRQLKNLSGIAGQNERLMRRLHHLTLKLANTPDLAAFIDELKQSLHDDFQADAIQLLLHQPPKGIGDSGAIAPLAEDRPAWLEKILAGQSPFCGRLTRQKRVQLLGDRADSLVSVALVPLGELGLLLIGAESPDRFHPDMGTLFLDLLGETVRLRLEALSQPQPSRRSA